MPLLQNLSIGFVGGDTALALEAEGEAATIEFVLDVMRDIFGSDVDKELLASHTTRWHADPWARGCYSASKPGHNSERRNVARTVGDRIFFAGEACVPKWATQVTAAYYSGLAAAENILVEIR